ncbi:hypothetical protein HRH25_04035 [Flavisolibacter sp. BT320]|nr:hypothetical protein [Flavisolibacter longurius]
MFHSDLRQEIAYLQAQLDYKRRKASEGFRQKIAFAQLEKLYDEIRLIETKLQVCFEESNAQTEENGNNLQ